MGREKEKERERERDKERKSVQEKTLGREEGRKRTQNN